MEQDNPLQIALASGGIERLVGPLRLVFWGGILCILDFNVNGFDVLNDIVGTLLITWGVLRLGSFEVHNRYRIAMRFVQVIAIISVAQAINVYLRYETPQPLIALWHIYGIAKMAATVVFCVAMRWLCIAAGLTRSESSWRITTFLFLVIYLIPWGLLHMVWIGCLITGKRFSFDLGPAVLLILIVFFLPLIHLFVSTSRMRAEVQSISHTADESPFAPDTFDSAESSD